ncbi:MAG: helix-turn-helix domain-containing protein [Saccharothrix sp.]|nr:helix-turn-helix domain-containing protein [Saccharothrix sp.]
MEGTPTLRGRLLGLELRRLRETAGLTVTELAGRTRQPPRDLQHLENGITDSWQSTLPAYRHVGGAEWDRLTGAARQADQPELWCAWDTEATTVLALLCHAAERIDLYAPLGIHPAIERLDRERCTAYVMESAVTGRTDVTTRVIPHSAGMHPGIEHNPVTYFRMPDGPAVVLYTYLHAAHFTEQSPHLLAAYTLFDRLDEFLREPS